MNSNRRRGSFALAILLVGMTLGCTPRVIVRAHPDAQDNGIRYYRPKPYLKIEPAEVAVDKNGTTFVPGMVRISLAYLPDFSEEYAIDVRSGFGTANVGIKLEDGWNLTEIDQDLDSQTDENLQAIGSVISAIGDVVPTKAGAAGAETVSFTVPSRNVPIGFYESVVGRDARGCKRLYGFRYVGFLPYAGCPLDMGGHQQACCGDGLHPLYGLTFDNGTMVFQPLDVMATSPLNVAPHGASTTSAPQASAAVDLTPQISNDQLAIQLHSFLTALNPAVGEVRITQRDAMLLIQIDIPANTPALPFREATENWLTQNLLPHQEFLVELNEQ